MRKGDASENLADRGGMVDGVAQLAAVAEAVGEERSELLHFADGVPHFRRDETVEVIELGRTSFRPQNPKGLQNVGRESVGRPSIYRRQFDL